MALVECPLCFGSFADAVIEQHASSCKGSPGLFSQPSPPSAPISSIGKKTKQTTLSWGGSQSKVDCNDKLQHHAAISNNRGSRINANRGTGPGLLIGEPNERQSKTDASAGGQHIETIDDDDDGLDIDAMIACVETLERNPATGNLHTRRANESTKTKSALVHHSNSAVSSKQVHAATSTSTSSATGAHSHAASVKSAAATRSSHTKHSLSATVASFFQPTGKSHGAALYSTYGGTERDGGALDGNGGSDGQTRYTSPGRPVQSLAHEQMQADGRYPQFDPSAGATWIYPSNFPERQYQKEICNHALYKNTLVCLPTGLGKTFIAAVVMYNLYRWYPTGKLVFMAPTKPLVAQQIGACFTIMGFDPDTIAEMTGSTNAERRETLWVEKRVFFLTPQVLQNDLRRNICPARDIVCLVVDEAHKATGRHAYNVCAQLIRESTPFFRVLALSATPGNNVKQVQEVTTNLHIAHIEIRNDESPDVKPFVHNKQVDVVLIKLNDMYVRIKQRIEGMLRDVASRLLGTGCLRANTDPSKFSTYMVLQAQKAFSSNQQNRMRGDFGRCMSDFGTLQAMANSYELFLTHGMGTVYKASLDDGTRGTALRKELARHAEYAKFFGEIQTFVVDAPQTDPSDPRRVAGVPTRAGTSATSTRVALPTWRHPKFQKMLDLLQSHFEKHAQGNGSTRAIIFATLRHAVDEIVDVLVTHPLIQAVKFVGQSSARTSRGLKQSEQLSILEQFRSGAFNTLVATSVAEEGLDIGDVDLILCFDAQQSSTRLVQRMGRTGRKRDGRVVLFVTEGREHAKHTQGVATQKRMFKSIVNAAKKFTLYRENPRMVPSRLTPALEKRHIVPGTRVSAKQAKANEKKAAAAEAAATKLARKKSKKSVPAKSTRTFLTASQNVVFEDVYRLKSQSQSMTSSQHATADLGRWPSSQIKLSETLIATHSARCKAYVKYMRSAMSVEESTASDSQESLTGSGIERSVMAHLEHADVWHPPHRTRRGRHGSNIIDDSDEDVACAADSDGNSSDQAEDGESAAARALREDLLQRRHARMERKRQRREAEALQSIEQEGSDAADDGPDAVTASDLQPSPKVGSPMSSPSSCQKPMSRKRRHGRVRLPPAGLFADSSSDSGSSDGSDLPDMHAMMQVPGTTVKTTAGHSEDEAIQAHSHEHTAPPFDEDDYELPLMSDLESPPKLPADSDDGVGDGDGVKDMPHVHQPNTALVPGAPNAPVVSTDGVTGVSSCAVGGTGATPAVQQQEHATADTKSSPAVSAGVVIARRLLKAPGALTNHLHSYVLGALCLKRRWNPVPEPAKSMTSVIASLELQAGVDPSKVRVQVSAVGGVLRFQGQTSKPVKPVKKSALSKTARRKHVRRQQQPVVTKTAKIPPAPDHASTAGAAIGGNVATSAPASVRTSTDARKKSVESTDIRTERDSVAVKQQRTIPTVEQPVAHHSVEDDNDDDIVELLDGIPDATDDTGACQTVQGGDRTAGDRDCEGPATVSPLPSHVSVVPPAPDTACTAANRDPMATPAPECRGAPVDSIAALVMDVQGLFDDDDDDDTDEAHAGSVVDQPPVADNNVPVATVDTATTTRCPTDIDERGGGPNPGATEPPDAHASHTGHCDTVPAAAAPPHGHSITPTPPPSTTAPREVPNTLGDLDFYIAGLLEDDEDDSDTDDAIDPGDSALVGPGAAKDISPTSQESAVAPVGARGEDAGNAPTEQHPTTATSAPTTQQDAVPDASSDESPAIVKHRAHAAPRVICYASDDDSPAAVRASPPTRTRAAVLETPTLVFQGSDDTIPLPAFEADMAGGNANDTSVSSPPKRVAGSEQCARENDPVDATSNDGSDDDADDSPIFVKRSTRRGTVRHHVLSTQCSPPHNPSPGPSASATGKRKRIQHLGQGRDEESDDDGSDDFQDFKRPTSTRRPKSKVRREMEQHVTRREQQERKRTEKLRAEARGFVIDEASCSDESDGDSDADGDGRRYGVEDSYRDGSQDSFIDDGSQSTMASCPSGGASTDGRGSQRRVRRRPSGAGHGTPQERERGPDGFALYRTSLLSPDEPGFFNDRAVYRGGQNKLVFGKQTPSPTSSDNEAGGDFQYDNPYSPRPIKRSRTHGRRQPPSLPPRSTARGHDTRTASASTGYTTRNPRPVSPRPRLDRPQHQAHTVPSTVHTAERRYDLCVTDILDDDDDDENE
eukprot:m.1491374 g.1491374  ORF g.1491374 m.1491374 type:complete len:2191 (-) comp25193_c0_seq1:434-7006(-)